MCGIAAFAGATPDLDLIAELGELAERRGPDGSGWAVYTDREGWSVNRDHEASLTAVPLPDGAGAARLIIGHSRLATDGGEDAAARCQPYVDDGVTVAFNGALPGSWPKGDTAEIMETVRAVGPQLGLLGFLEQADRLDADRLAVVVGVGWPGVHGPQLWTAQRAGFYGTMPLFIRRDGAGLYLCSRKFAGAVEMTRPGVRCLAATGLTDLVVSSRATADEERTA